MPGSMTNIEGDLFEQLGRLQRGLEDFWGSPRGPASIRAVAHGTYPAINVGASPECIDIYVFAAGLDRDSIDLSVQQSLLTISGDVPARQPKDTSTYLKERFQGKFRRTLSLPEDIDPDSADASYRNGVLHINFRRKAEARPRKIKIHESVEG